MPTNDGDATVDAATTENINLFGEQVIDIVPLKAGDRVLVKNQINEVENSIYVVDPADWIKTDLNMFEAVAIVVKGGAVNRGSSWLLSSQGADVLAEDLNFGDGDINFVSGPTIKVESVDPTVNDDQIEGIDVGTLWYSNNELKICVDNTQGAAIWVTTGNSNVSSGSGSSSYTLPDVVPGKQFLPNHVEKYNGDTITGSQIYLDPDVSRYYEVKPDTFMPIGMTTNADNNTPYEMFVKLDFSFSGAILAWESYYVLHGEIIDSNLGSVYIARLVCFGDGKVHVWIDSATGEF